MTVRETRRKLQAWEASRPLPRYDTIHHAVVPEALALIVAFVRMGGESRPWGIAWGTVDSGPRISAVPDGRVRDDVAELCAELAEELLAHLRVHNWTFDPVGERAEVSELRQVWLPNGQHIAMLHQLDYAYSQTRFGGVNNDILRALGRLAGWMFRDTSRRGNQHVVDASRALGDAFVFPAQEARTAHLGYQLAWLTTRGGLDERMLAATAAEGLTVSPTMDPTMERENLSGLVEEWQAARRENGDMTSRARDISSTLSPELERRWMLTADAYRLLADDDRPINTGVEGLVKEAHNEFWYQHQRIELRHNDPNQGPAFVAHPETDFHGSSAASRFLIHEAADEAYVGLLIHDDHELFEECLEEGRALLGTVVEVIDLGSAKSPAPYWILRVHSDSQHRLREGARITPCGSRRHEATITSLDINPNSVELLLEWTGRRTMALESDIRAKPNDQAWVGHEVAFVVSDAADLTKRRSFRVWKAKDGPGAWLTHGTAPAPIEITTDEDGTDLLVDDIRQIEEGVIT